MNILIIGEYSGFARHLKNGFKRLGHKVTIVMRPDSFKRFKGEEDDIVYGSNLYFRGRAIRGSALLLSPVRAILLRIRLKHKYNSLTPDLVLVINYEFLTNSYLKVGFPLGLLEDMIKRGAKLIMSVCGLDPSFYYLYPQFFIRAGVKPMLDDERYSFLLNNANAIVPTAYDYYLAVNKYCESKGYEKRSITNEVPLPYTFDNTQESHVYTGEKIVIFHGIIRPKAKGTEFIQQAMSRLEAEMPEKVECICKGGIPYDEYIKLFKRIDILVDQTYGNGWGMNALIGAANGKCVLVACGKENAENMGIPKTPFIQIGPDSEQIYETLRSLVLNREKLNDIKNESRRFVEDYCECGLIAKKYLDIVEL